LRAPKVALRAALVGDIAVTQRQGGTSLESAKSRDWLRQPMALILWWGLPIALGVSTNFWHRSPAWTSFAWAVALAWMGTGCVLNALRCRRFHCFIAGPVLWLGAIASGLVALGILSGSGALGEVINGTLAVAALSFLAECCSGFYARIKAR